MFKPILITRIKLHSFSHQQLTAFARFLKRFLLVSSLVHSSNLFALPQPKYSLLQLLSFHSKIEQKRRLQFTAIKELFLPVHIRKVTVQKSAFVHKKARSQYELRTYKANITVSFSSSSQLKNFIVMQQAMKKGYFSNIQLLFSYLNYNYYDTTSCKN